MKWMLALLVFGVSIMGLSVQPAKAEIVCGVNGCVERHDDRRRDYDRRRDDYRQRDHDRRRDDEGRYRRPSRDCAYVAGVRVCQ
jgi:hypothetical protein